MNNPVIRFGVFSGLAATILFLGPLVVSPDSFLKPENMASGEVIGYASMFLAMLLVFFGVRAHRKEKGGSYSFGDGIKAGLLITAISTVVFYIGNVLVYEVIRPGFLETFFDFYVSHMEESGMAPEKVAEMKGNRAMMINGYTYAAVMSSTTLMMGIIISLISALALKRTATA